jgi:hypothetical protein
MLITGLLIYYLYLKPEPFQPTDPAPEEQIDNEEQIDTEDLIELEPEYDTSECPPQIEPLPAAILSRYFGVGFNIYPADGTTAESLYLEDSNAIFLIEHIPVVYNGTNGSMYSVSNGQLTLKLRNDLDPDQWWIIVSLFDEYNSSVFNLVIPYNLANNDPQLTLQYENGNLALRPLNTDFESQKWIFSNTKITRAIPVLNYGPASLFTPEFNPYSSSSSSTSLTQQNNQQVNDVVNLIKSNIQQYIATVNGNQSTTGNLPPVSSSSLGNKNMPLNINVNLGGSKSGSGVSTFENITGTTTGTDLLSLLDKYETTQAGTSQKNQLYTGSDLENALRTYQGCSSINIGDYTSNRVSTCNCKL